MEQDVEIALKNAVKSVKKNSFIQWKALLKD